MKDSRNPSAWTLREIEADASGYVAAQQARKQDEAAANAQRAEQLDRAAFEREYISAGGTRTGAGDAYRQKRDEQAREAARTADETARRLVRGHTMGKL